MSYTVNWNTKVFTIPLADLTLISGNNYSLDASDLWIEVRRLEASPIDGLYALQAIEFVDTQTLSGIVYVPIVKFINGYTWDINSSNINVSLIGPNSNLLDQYIPGNGISVLANNSAGKQQVGSGVLQADYVAIIDELMTRVMENGETFAEQQLLIRAEAAGSIEKTGTLHKIKSADGITDRITATADENGRNVSAVDPS